MSKRQHTTAGDTPTTKKSKPSGHWSMGLLSTIDDPNYFVKSDDLINVIKDKYPKAKFHYLIMPKDNISSLKSVKSGHNALLKHMEEVALEMITEEKHKNSNFKVGYHAEASMARLHLHVISDDMISDCLKTKKHWNSFVTEFFIKSEDIRENLKKNGKLELPSKELCKKLMDTPLNCHKCTYTAKNMKDLKIHILKH